MSSGRPIRPSGAAAAICSPCWASVVAIILDSNGPGATALTVICRGPSSRARTRVSWCSPALLAEYEYVLSSGTRRPSMLPTLITRAGSSAVPAASSSGRNARVRKNGVLRFRSRTLSQAEAGNSASGAPQVAPALLTRMWTRSSDRPTSSASRRHSSSRDRSAGTDSATPYWDSSATAACPASARRELMYTEAPACSSPRAIIRPIPRPPPLMTATFPVRSNKSTRSSKAGSVEVTVAGIDDLRVHSEDLGELFDHHVEDELAQLVLVLGPGQQRAAEQHDAGAVGRVPRVAGVGGPADDAGQRHAFVGDDGVEVWHFLDRELHVGQFGLPARLQPRDRLEHDVVELLGSAAVQRDPGRDQPAAQPAAMAITPPRPGPWPRTAFAGMHSYRAYKITSPPGAHARHPATSGFRTEHDTRTAAGRGDGVTVGGRIPSPLYPTPPFRAEDRHGDVSEVGWVSSRCCSRTACKHPPVYTLTYVYRDSTAVLGPLAAYVEPHCYDLCEKHAGRLTAPRGWDVVRLPVEPVQDRAEGLEALANAVMGRQQRGRGKKESGGE